MNNNDRENEQLRWERDIAIEQLNELGLSLGQKVDHIKEAINRQKGIELFGNEHNPVWVGDTVSGLCPICMTKFVCITPKYYKENGYGYCKECGQKIKW